MRTRIPSLLLPAVLALIASLMLVAGALGAEMGFSATWPMAARVSADGSGTAAITIDPDTGQVCWDLSGRWHRRRDGVAHPRWRRGRDPATWSCRSTSMASSGTSSDCVDASDADLDAIIANPAGYYVNIHTEDFPAGAIRGQLVADSPDTAMQTPTSSPWAALGLLLVGMAGVFGVRAARRRA